MTIQHARSADVSSHHALPTHALPGGGAGGPPRPATPGAGPGWVHLRWGKNVSQHVAEDDVAVVNMGGLHSLIGCVTVATPSALGHAQYC